MTKTSHPYGTPAPIRRQDFDGPVDPTAWSRAWVDGDHNQTTVIVHTGYTRSEDPEGHGDLVTYTFLPEHNHGHFSGPMPARVVADSWLRSHGYTKHQPPRRFA